MRALFQTRRVGLRSSAEYRALAGGIDPLGRVWAGVAEQVLNDRQIRAIVEHRTREVMARVVRVQDRRKPEKVGISGFSLAGE